eukprot:scaffold73841_cov36-Tisochrysis_lutea.AAC.1
MIGMVFVLMHSQLPFALRVCRRAADGGGAVRSWPLRGSARGTHGWGAIDLPSGRTVGRLAALAAAPHAQLRGQRGRELHATGRPQAARAFLDLLSFLVRSCRCAAAQRALRSAFNARPY